MEVPETYGRCWLLLDLPVYSQCWLMLGWQSRQARADAIPCLTHAGAGVCDERHRTVH